ncbi:MAG: hypothetical protein UH083_05940, partial [Ruminococcus sp.]|nr:hypothetical protein [Ruminococcus sp.]
LDVFARPSFLINRFDNVMRFHAVPSLRSMIFNVAMGNLLSFVPVKRLNQTSHWWLTLRGQCRNQRP